MIFANASDSRVSEEDVTAQAKQIAAFEAELSKVMRVLFFFFYLIIIDLFIVF